VPGRYYYDSFEGTDSLRNAEQPQRGSLRGTRELDGRAKQIARVVVIILGVISLLKYIAVF
jgi:hypothetical protein